jgi:hypothetical protein
VGGFNNFSMCYLFIYFYMDVNLRNQSKNTLDWYVFSILENCNKVKEGMLQFPTPQYEKNLSLKPPLTLGCIHINLLETKTKQYKV